LGTLCIFWFPCVLFVLRPPSYFFVLRAAGV
jgi:hypothetical protein